MDDECAIWLVSHLFSGSATMNTKLALLLCVFAAFVAADLSGSAQVTANGNAASAPLTGDVILAPLLPTLSVTSNATGTVTFSLKTVNLFTIISNTANGFTFSGGISFDASGNSNGASGSAGVFANAGFAGGVTGILNIAANLLALQLDVSFKDSNGNNAAAQLTVSGTFAKLAANGNLQVGLFASSSDSVSSGGSSASTSSSATVAGAVPYSINTDGSYSYTVIVPAQTTTFLIKPFDATQAKSSNNGATAASSGSSSFSTSGFIPVALGYDFNLQGGQQYAFGNNIQVTPSASSGSAGTLKVQFNGFLNGASTTGNTGSTSSQSKPPNSASASTGSNLFFNGYYQFTGSSNANNVIQFSAPASNTNLFTNSTTSTSGSNSTSTSASASVNSVGQAVAAGQAKLSWYKSTASGSAEAGATWFRQASTSTYSASAGLKVYASVSSYSQWTVASSNGAATALQYAIGTLLLSALLVISF
ncbi:cell wall surface anchor family protein [Planoprotostelium fungivorum]|uniref:Cell wall surface anchor family protein n=1 Tax=Planoprotostelium fungivorum TaxID=1890364 RepID=A0A2P6N5B7_9EUKA|nr:cell wall surface anchor family protein [Planoprotostelium fungivorum]